MIRPRLAESGRSAGPWDVTVCRACSGAPWVRRLVRWQTEPQARGPEGAISGYIRARDDVELERVEILELLGMILALLNLAEARAEMSPRVALLLAIRDKLAHALQEDI